MITLCGHIPDAPDPRDRRFDASPLLRLASVYMPGDAIDLRPHLPPVTAQIARNCCGHATAAAAYGTAAIAGRPIARASAPFAYSVSRLKEPRVPGQPRLIDRGCSLRNMFRGLGEWGLVSDERWPEVPETIDVIPPDDCFRAGEGARVSAYYRIEDGPGASVGLLGALRRGLLPVFGMVVDSTYAEIGDGVYTEPGGDVLGGHAQVVVGFSPGRDAFLVRNSWGRGFGDEGHAWIAASFMDRATFDKWVIEVSPSEVT